MSRTHRLLVLLCGVLIGCGGSETAPIDSPPVPFLLAISEYTGPLTIVRSDGVELGRVTCTGLHCTPLGPKISRDGSLVAFTGYPDTSSVLYVANVDGSGVRELARVYGELVHGGRIAGDYHRQYFFWPEWSADHRLLFVRAGKTVETILPDGSGDRVIISGDSLSRPHWSAADTMISVQVGRSAILGARASDGSGARQLFTTTDDVEDHAWAPDGSALMVQTSGVQVGGERLIRVDARDLTVRVIAGSQPYLFINFGFCWSPDSRTVVFLADSGVYVASSAGQPTTFIATPLHFESGAAWTPDARSVLFTADSVNGGPSQQLQQLSLTGNSRTYLLPGRRITYFSTLQSPGCSSNFYSTTP